MSGPGHTFGCFAHLNTKRWERSSTFEELLKERHCAPLYQPCCVPESCVEVLELLQECSPRPSSTIQQGRSSKLWQEYVWLEPYRPFLLRPNAFQIRGGKISCLFSNSPQSNKLTIESKHLVGPKVQVTVDRTETDSGLDSLCDNGSPLWLRCKNAERIICCITSKHEILMPSIALTSVGRLPATSTCDKKVWSDCLCIIVAV